MSIWGRKKRMPRQEPPEAPEPEPRSHIPLPADTIVDQDAALAGKLQMQHWLDEAYEQFVQRGGIEHLPGKGKPLVIPTGDVMNTLLKNANVPHPWVLLRQIIQESLEETIHLMERNPADPRIDEQISEINKKIVTLNGDAPSMTLQRRKVTRDNIRVQYEKWQ